MLNNKTRYFLSLTTLNALLTRQGSKKGKERRSQDMKLCKRCFREYDEPETFTTPMEELGKLFLRSAKGDEVDSFCPECKKELGMLNLLGVGK